MKAGGSIAPVILQGIRGYGRGLDDRSTCNYRREILGELKSPPGLICTQWNARPSTYVISVGTSSLNFTLSNTW